MPLAGADDTPPAAVLFGARRLGVGFGGGFAPAFGVDRLSGFFLAVPSLIAVSAAVYARDALGDVRAANNPTSARPFLGFGS